MKQVFSIFSVAFLSLALLASGCKKGDDGPEGPEGPAGPQGPPGAQGPKGDSGTANVIYSNWLDVSYTAQTNQAGDTTFFYYSQWAIPKLTAAILNQGVVKTYINWGTTAAPEIDPLPLVDLVLYGISITTTFTPGQALLISNDNYGTYTDNTGKHNTYRYVLIPGGVPARSAINWNDYESVKKYLNLPD